jgi:hypothetical protein
LGDTLASWELVTTMENIERFDAYALHIFGDLYERFPVGRVLDPAAIVKAAGLPVKKGGEVQEADIVQATIDWLRTTGFLLWSDESNTKDKMRYPYVLAPMAFAALRRELPDAVKGKNEKGKPKSLGEKAVEFGKTMAKSMAAEGGKKLAAELVTLGIGWFFKGGSSGGAV